MLWQQHLQVESIAILRIIIFSLLETGRAYDPHEFFFFFFQLFSILKLREQRACGRTERIIFLTFVSLKLVRTRC